MSRLVWRKQTFVVDSGSEMTTMPAFAAKRLGLAMPLQAAAGVIHAPTDRLVDSLGLAAGQDCRHGPDGVFFPVFLSGRPSNTSWGRAIGRPRQRVDCLA